MVRGRGRPNPVGVTEREPEAKPEPWTCPNCGRLCPGENIHCLHCGYSASQGVTAIDKSCYSCGYDLSGLKSVKCPECGTINSARNRRRARTSTSNRDVQMEFYIKPLLVAAVATLVLFGTRWSIGSFRSAAWQELIIAASTLVSFVFYVLLGLVWWGFDAPLHVCLIRLFCIVSCAMLPWSLFFMSPIPFWIPSSMMAFIAWLMCVKYLDLHLDDARVFTIFVVGSLVGTTYVLEFLI